MRPRHCGEKFKAPLECPGHGNTRDIMSDVEEMAVDEPIRDEKDDQKSQRDVTEVEETKGVIAGSKRAKKTYELPWFALPPELTPTR